MAKDKEEFYGEMEEHLVNEEYKIWKKKTLFLYYLVIIHTLKWPSLIVQWLPEHEDPHGKYYFVQNMILGTHNSNNEIDYLMLSQVQILLEDAENDSRQYDDEHGEIGGFNCASMVVNDIVNVVWNKRIQ
jgi:histone-binding protein RBBP4